MHLVRELYTAIGRIAKAAITYWWRVLMSCTRYSEGSGVSCAFHPSFELGKVQKDAAIRRFAPDATFQPNSTFDLVAHRVLAVASDFGKPLDEYPSAWIAHGVLPVCQHHTGD